MQETGLRGKDSEGKEQAAEKGARHTLRQVAPLPNYKWYPSILPFELAYSEEPEKLNRS